MQPEQPYVGPAWKALLAVVCVACAYVGLIASAVEFNTGHVARGVTLIVSAIIAAVWSYDEVCVRKGKT